MTPPPPKPSAHPHRVQEVNKHSRKAGERKEDRRRDEEVAGEGRRKRKEERGKRRKRDRNSLSQFLGIKDEGGTRTEEGGRKEGEAHWAISVCLEKQHRPSLFLSDNNNKTLKV